MVFYYYFHFIASADFGLSTIVSNKVSLMTVCGTPGYCGEFNSWHSVNIIVEIVWLIFKFYFLFFKE